jgi:hypothetical protein
MARFEMTSFTFMLVCVPLPVCQMRNGNWSYSLPAITSSAACTISFAFSAGNLPRSWFTRAQAFFSVPNARIISGGMVSRPMLKCSSERWVCAPQ